MPTHGHRDDVEVNCDSQTHHATFRYGVVPIADLLNHEGGKPSTWSMEYHDGERKGDPTMFVMEANQDYQPGQELTISYGDHRSAYNFFVYSG